MSSFLDKLRGVRTRLGPLWWHTGLMFGASRIADMAGVYIGMFLVPAWMDREKLGVVLPITRLAVLAAMPATAISSTAIKYINRFLLREEHGKVRCLLRDLTLFSLIASLLFSAAIVIFWSPLSGALRMDDAGLLPLTVLLIVLSCWTPVAFMAVQGLNLFYPLSLSRLTGPLGRLIVILFLLRPLQVAGYLAGHAAFVLFTLLALVHGPFAYLRRHRETASYRDERIEMARYTLPAAVAVVLIGLQQTIEPWAVRQLLADVDSAGYYVAYMFGSIPLWVAPAMLPFLFPMVSERYERGESTRRMHLQTLGVVLVVGGLIAVVLALWGRWLVALRPSWRMYAAYAPFMWPLALATTVDTLLICHMTHENACRRFSYLRFVAPVLVCEILFLCLPIWALASTLPLAARLAPWFAARLSLPLILAAILTARVILLMGIAAALLKDHGRYDTRSGMDDVLVKEVDRAGR